MVSSEEIRRRLEAKRRGETFSEVKKTPPSSAASKTCPECQTSNPESAKFCVGCGAPLAREETPTSSEVSPSSPSEVTPATSSGETPTVTPTSTVDDYKQCPSCGQKNKPDAKFCIICGHKFEKESDFEKESATEKPLEPLVEVVEEEKEVPVAETKPNVPPSEDEADLQEPVTEQEPAETPESETPEKSVIPEVKVPEQFKSNNVQPEEEIAPAESAEVQSKEETAPAEDPVIRIKKAKELLDIGAITQEEFDKIKNKYLDLI
ncbi:zinc-ribbon domain-containing protein [uncultured Methanobacterium sp.]|uniref:zinc-ribbon domain-containing protein n=1 Tax=uncultured Methanobacterium sp. TaxID=176306 RepID=UPI002AA7DF1B|nr:zinc-ribbon domain-containing protein [uncultured Methanobacterium sp.]